LQPEKLRDETFLNELRALQPDLGIVIAFRMLPEVVWAMPQLGTFNLHASLLPEYRGAAPINWAIINGDKRTGVTTFLLNHEIDKGAIIEQEAVDILDEDNIGTLYDKLMNIGAELVLKTVDKVAEGGYEVIEQMHIDESTLRPAPKIFKDDCLIKWDKRGEDIVNLVRGLSPYPAAWTYIYKDGAECGTAKIFKVRFEVDNREGSAGRVVTDGRGYFGVRCADGVVYIEELQMAGKKRMAIKDLLLGWRDAVEVTF
jgi:methionyl-tRNA formyltransferase